MEVGKLSWAYYAKTCSNVARNILPYFTTQAYELRDASSVSNRHKRELISMFPMQDCQDCLALKQE